ncbi:MAG: 4Fe-4S binding protein [Candidatus Helarchaeota archaeon]
MAIPFKGMCKVEDHLHKYELRLLTWKAELYYDLNKCVGCLFCIQTCPKEAISRVVERNVEFNVVDTELCSMCGQCDYICPSNAFQFFIDGERKNLLVENNSLPPLIVTEINGKKGKLRKFVEGRLEIDLTKWTAECNPAIDKCPTDCLSLNAEKNLEVDESLCIYCGNCERECMNAGKDDVIKVIRKRLLYKGALDEFSAPWNEIIKKLVSFEEMAKDLKAKSAIEASDRVKTLFKHFIH